MPSPGERIATYVVESPLGAGAMGEVWRARRSDGWPVVLKFLEPRLDAPRLRDRFLREGSALARLPRHPNIVGVYEVLPDEEPPCLVMELVPGASLADHLRSNGPFAPREAARLARDVARGMAVVHARGMLHRDLKPANLLLTPAGQVRIVDFGLVKEVLATAITEPGQLLGTAPYMAPECWLGEPVIEPAVDVFALGATLYELIAGAPPFVGSDLQELAEKVAEGAYVPLRERAPQTPPDLEAIVAQLLAAKRRFRYSTMGACRDDLERFLHGEACEVPRLEGQARGQLVSLDLLGRRRVVIGRDPDKCELVLSEPTVAATHAQLRVRAEGYELRDLRSPSGTYVNGEALSGAVLLPDGAEIVLGQATLWLRDPRARPAPAPFLKSALRAQAPLDELELLLRADDRRALGWGLELVLADPTWAGSVRARLAPLGEEAARELAAAAASERARVREWLLTRDARRATPQAWLAAWIAACAEGIEQWAPPGVAACLNLVVDAGEVGWEPLPLAGEEILLVGRDPKCHVRLRNRTVSRHHATLLRVHEVWVARDEGRSTPTLLDGAPYTTAHFGHGARLSVGDVILRAQAEPPVGDLAVDPWVFRALLARNHPAACAALVDELARPTAAAAPLFPDAAQAQQAARSLAATRRSHETRARLLLAAHLGGEAQDPPRAWRQRLAASRDRLGPQVRT